MKFGPPKDTADTKQCASSSSHFTKQCASCGKWSDALKKCTACQKVWYCNVSCQKAHRKEHKERCKFVAKMRREFELAHPGSDGPVLPDSEISDMLGMFESPPKEDCVICMLPLPFESMMVAYQACCGKRLCSGCVFEHQRVVMATNTERESDEDLAHLPLLDDNCAFCREPTPDPFPSLENLRRLQKRVELGDAYAMKQMGLHHMKGRHGLPVDKSKALEFFHRAADLGDPGACDELHKAYVDSDYLGASWNPAKAFEYQVLLREVMSSLATTSASSSSMWGTWIWQCVIGACRRLQV